MDLIDGVHSARIFEYSIGKTKAGLPQVVIQFDVLFGNDPGGTGKRLTWYGSLKEGKAREITLTALSILGLGNAPLERIAHGAMGNVLDATKTYPVTVQHQPDLNGQLRPRITWIGGNTPDPKKYSVSIEDARSMLKNIGMESHTTNEPAPHVSPSSAPGDDEVPF